MSSSDPFDDPVPSTLVLSPMLSADEAMARIVSGDFGFFFTTQQDRESVSIKVGLITDHSVSGASPSDDPTFLGYVILGGHSICTSSGPAPVPPDTVGDRRGPCHAEIIINGDTGAVSTESQIGG